MLACAFILTHEGYPCVLWQDYFNWNLAQEGDFSGIAALVQVHEKHASGTTCILHLDDDLYVMPRDGQGTQRGLVLVLNNRSTWNGAPGSGPDGLTHCFLQKPGEEATIRVCLTSGPMEATELWAPPWGYAVYVPQ